MTERARRPFHVLCVAVALAAAGCGGSGGSGATPTTPAPAATGPSSEPAGEFPIHDGTYERIEPVTEEDALACGLEGDLVQENLGGYTLELTAGGWVWSSVDPPAPVQYPVWRGSYEATETELSLLVEFPTFFAGQRWTMSWVLDGDALVFSDVSVEPPDEQTQAAVECDFAGAPYRTV